MINLGAPAVTPCVNAFDPPLANEKGQEIPPEVKELGTLTLKILLLDLKSHPNTSLSPTPRIPTVTHGKGLAVKEGEGWDNTKVGDKVKVHNAGTLLVGTKFDSSHYLGTLFKFKIGQGQMKRNGMKVSKP